MLDNIKQILTVGENVAVEFKRCGNGIKADAYSPRVHKCKAVSLRHRAEAHVC